jgi:DNA-binding GntR family transcriptional regulator
MTDEKPHSTGKATQVPLADMVFEHLLERIYNGTLALGSVVNEAALSLEYNVSRGPVREAVRRLQGVQLVTREPYVKARVAVLTPEGALELFQMRMGLEGMSCKLAAERMSDAEIAALLADFEQDRQNYLLQRAAQNGTPARVFDFHERIVKASRNQRIIDLLCGDLYHLLRIYRRRSGSVSERKDEASAEHWQILRAIKARDGELAESLMRSHIGRAADHLFRNLAAEPRNADQSEHPEHSPAVPDRMPERRKKAASAPISPGPADEAMS